MSKPTQDHHTANIVTPPQHMPIPPVSEFEHEEMIEPVRSRVQLAAIVIALYLTMFIAALDQTIIATAIPTITASLNGSSGYFWLGGAYLLAAGAFGPIWAKCSDIWGRKPAILSAVAIFNFASILAATSVNMSMLIAARGLQGMGGGALLSLTTITISDLFSVRKRSLIYGGMEVVWALAGGLGPITGGALTQKVSWRWCFWINVPVCVVAFVLLFVYLNVHNPRTALRSGLAAIDWTGIISILGVVLLLLLGLDFGGNTFAWSSAQVICMIVFGTVMIGVFFFSQKKIARYPLVPMQMFENSSTVATMILAFCHGMVYIAGEYYLPLYFQSAKGASPLRSGVLVLPLTLAEACAGLATGIIIHQTGRYRELIWTGFIFMTLGTGLFILFSPSTSVAVIAILQIISGGGAGLLFQTPIIAIQAVVSQADTATATATLGFARTVATAISLVLGGVVFQNSMDAQSSHLKAVGLDSSLLQALTGSHAAANVELIPRISDPTQNSAVKAAFAASLRNMWIMYTCVSAVGLLASLFLKHRELSQEHTETQTGIEKMTDRRRLTAESEVAR